MSKWIPGKGFVYPHMCRDEHVEIGHADNSSEMCPMCRVIAERDRLTQQLEKSQDVIKEVATLVPDSFYFPGNKVNWLIRDYCEEIARLKEKS